jgi:hypothetical protein
MSFQEDFANAYATTLASPATSGATTVTLGSVTNAPTANSGGTPPTGFRAIIDGDTPNVNTEIVWVTDLSGTTATVTRAAESFPGGCAQGSPVAHASGVPFRAILTADSFTFGLSPVRIFRYPGNPNSHVTASADGDLCVDTSTPALYQASAATNGNWSALGGGAFPTYSGSGSPEGAQTGAVGESYEDTTNGAVYFKASGSGNTGWVGSNVQPNLHAQTVTSPIPGVYVDPADQNVVFLLGGSHSGWVLTDIQAYASGGTTNGLFWDTNGTDGDQLFEIYTGSSGQFFWSFRADGTTRFPDAVNTGASQTSGALPTVTITSGTAHQVDATHDRQLVVATTTAGSVQVEISPDNTTFSTLYTKTTVASDEVSVMVPGGWYVKITATASTLGTATFY